MKLIFGVSIIVVFALPSWGQANLERVKILQIDSTDNYFFIKGRTQKSGEKILVVSAKQVTKNDCGKIELKRTYLLELTEFLDSEILRDLPVKPPGTIRLREDGYIIWVGKSSLPKRAKNIRGLCLDRSEP